MVDSLLATGENHNVLCHCKEVRDLIIGARSRNRNLDASGSGPAAPTPRRKPGPPCLCTLTAGEPAKSFTWRPASPPPPAPPKEMERTNNKKRAEATGSACTHRPACRSPGRMPSRMPCARSDTSCSRASGNSNATERNQSTPFLCTYTSYGYGPSKLNRGGPQVLVLGSIYQDSILGTDF